MDDSVTLSENGKGRKREVNKHNWKRMKMQVLRYVLKLF